MRPPARGSSIFTPSRVLMSFVFLSLGFWTYTAFNHQGRIKTAAALGALPAHRTTQARELKTDPPPVDVCAESNWIKDTEVYGDVVKTGQVGGVGPGLHFATATECCRECERTKGCNRWVWCQLPSECHQACWLKRASDPEEDPKRFKGMSAVWHSGAIDKDYNKDPATIPVNASITELRLHTGQGIIRITLKPEWSQASVDYVRRMAAHPELCSTQCQFYRAEPGFLLQGSLRGFIPPNTEKKEGPKIMERGEIGWAGGGPGPDWFIYLGDKPATHFGTSHTVWGVVADQESLDVVEKIVRLPAAAEKPGAMHMLVNTVGFFTSAGP